MTDLEKKASKKYFYEKYKFPGVIGAIDGTHIQIIRPNYDEHLFFNRKLKHSINAMIICDYKMNIRAVDGCFGGASHDSFICDLSSARKYLRSKYMNGDTSLLLGNSAYKLEPWLITPYRLAVEGSAEAKFNEIHSKVRSVVERTFRLLKARFRCLLYARQLYYSPQKATRFLNVCCALHNICLAFKVDNRVESPSIDDGADVIVEENHPPENVTSDASVIRNNIKLTL